MMKTQTLRDTIITFMKGCNGGVATLKQIYAAIDKSEYVSNSNTVHDSARAIIYRHPGEFKRVLKGVYLYTGENSSSLLIEGDGRNLSEIEDNSIDCIITDHPWSDKKAHTSGNQKNFVNYDTFSYTLDDFKAKARVLKEDSYLAEFMPVESATNWEYLSKVKQMAKEAGFEYYASCIWRKAPEGAINNGRTTKGVEQILLFTKGKPRRLAPKGKPYMTKGMLSYEIDIPIKAKEKVHQAEKPLALYEYLIENLTEEHDVCLDQFGGACNMLKAAVNKNRFAIVYEYCHDFVKKAAERFSAIQLVDNKIDETEWNKMCQLAYKQAKEGMITGGEIIEELTRIYKNFIDNILDLETAKMALNTLKTQI